MAGISYELTSECSILSWDCDTEEAKEAAYFYQARVRKGTNIPRAILFVKGRIRAQLIITRIIGKYGVRFPVVSHSQYAEE
jgi:hypothetical protein